MAEADGAKVQRRRVFYIPGFDPFPPRRYRELYRKEAAAQAAISGYEIALSPQGAEARGGYGWQVEAQIGGQRTLALFDVMVWSDIVQRSMGHGILATYWQMLRTAVIYAGSGALIRLMRLRKGPTIAAFYPVAVLLAELVVALGAGWVVRQMVDWAGAPEVAGWAAGLLAAWAVLWRFRKADGRIYAYYLMHDYAFSARGLGADPPELTDRLACFAAQIDAALHEDWDEVLVVGHSSGAHLAVMVLADLIQRGRLPAQGPALGLLTLGQVTPMQSFLPRATRLRGALAYLSTRDDLAWVDVTAPGDGCAFALCDPVAVSGVAPPDKRWPLVLSAAFTQTLSPQRWRALRWRFFRLHFQYLCAFDQPGDYDYFQITAGPRTLGDRFRGRAPSKSRIETPMSGYRSVA